MDEENAMEKVSGLFEYALVTPEPQGLPYPLLLEQSPDKFLPECV